MAAEEQLVKLSLRAFSMFNSTATADPITKTKGKKQPSFTIQEEAAAAI